MFRNLFHPDSDLMIFMSRVTDCIFLSLFFLMGCIPVVTVGASFAALYGSSFRGIRKGDKLSWHRFWEIYKENWKGSILPAVLMAVVIFGAGKGLIALWNASVAGSVSWMIFCAVALLGVLLLGILSILFPMLSRFENTLSALLKNTVLLGLANLPRTVVLGIVNAAAVFVCVKWIVPVFFVPALAAFLGSFLIEPMFKPYMPEEEIADEDMEEDKEDIEE